MTLETALSSSDDAQNLTIAGKAVAHAQGSHRLSTIQNKAQGGATFRFAPVPQVETDHPVPMSLQGWNLVIPKKSKHPELAWDLIQLWVSKDVQTMQAVEAGYLPIRRSVADDPAFRSDKNLAFDLPGILEYATAHPMKFHWPENSDALNDVIHQMVQRVLTGQMTAEDATVWGDQAYNDLRR